MSDLIARFKLVDEVSDKLGSLAESGSKMVEQWEKGMEAINSAFSGISDSVNALTSAVSAVTSAVDGIASSIDKLQGAAGGASSSNDRLRESGVRSTDALERQQRLLVLCEQSAGSLGRSVDAAADTHNKLGNAIERADKVMESIADNEKVSAQTKADLAQAAEKASDAMGELEKAQQEADEAMEAYKQALASGTTDLDQLEAAAQRAGDAADALAQANARASEATDELSNASENAANEAENAGTRGTDAIGAVAGALAAAGITAIVKEIAGAVYDLADSFTEAEKTIIGATGATGRELDEFMSSSLDVYASSSAESLNDVAAGMMSVRTATGLTGDALENATDAAIVFNNVFG